MIMKINNKTFGRGYGHGFRHGRDHIITTVSLILKEMLTTRSGRKMSRNQKKMQSLKGSKVLVTHLEPHLGKQIWW